MSRCGCGQASGFRAPDLASSRGRARQSRQRAPNSAQQARSSGLLCNTGLYANIGEEATGDGGWVIQWPDQAGDAPATNEIFYLHPTVATD